jgi:hypothetical protein
MVFENYKYNHAIQRRGGFYLVRDRGDRAGKTRPYVVVFIFHGATPGLEPQNPLAPELFNATLYKNSANPNAAGSFRSAKGLSCI